LDARGGSKARELVFSGLPYIVVYRVRDQIVEVMRIDHGAQDTVNIPEVIE
jgi:plasmid stabilization system protein ParE